ncbi:MAG: YkgJ family cysteine cluster protein [Planctomycetaceae bacterium]
MDVERDENGEAWYRDGLCFSCTQCGNCCTGAPGVVWVSDEELRRIAEFLKISIGELRVHHTRLVGRRVSLTEYGNGDCTFFDPQTRGCKIYPVRPTQCQTWPFWPSNIASVEDWEEVKAVCPGSGQGNFYPLEQIEAQARRMDV